MPRRRPTKARQRRLAAERVSKLLSAAESELRTNPERSSRYVHLSRTIIMRCNIRMPKRWRRRICKRCNTLLVPGRTSKVRLREGRLNVTCTRCGMVYRYPYRG